MGKDWTKIEGSEFLTGNDGIWEIVYFLRGVGMFYLVEMVVAMNPNRRGDFRD